MDAQELECGFSNVNPERGQPMGGLSEQYRAAMERANDEVLTSEGGRAERCAGGIMMSDKNLILTLAKVIIAAAWADGEMTLEEINSLKELLFRLPRAGGVQITGREWAMLEMYIESPPADAKGQGAGALGAGGAFPGGWCRDR